MQQATTQATFLSLSPELRNSIYKLMLTTCTTEPLHIAVLPANCKSQAHIGIKRSSDHGVPFRCSKILRASKFIHQEARSILYGDNIFLFMEPQSLRIFASCIGNNKANLRHVQLKIGRPKTTHMALKALYPTPSLQHLDIASSLHSSKHGRMLVQPHWDEELREATVAFVAAGQTFEECEKRFAAIRLCGTVDGSGKWEVVVD